MRPDKEAEYCEFVTARFESLRRFAFLIGGDWHRAEDAVQTAFIKLYVSWNRTTPASLDAYVRRMVINATIDVCRRSWFKIEHSKGDVPDHPDPRRHGHTEESITLLAALAKLPVRRRATLVLRYWEDRSVEDTAQIMGCSVATVKSQTSRGLRTLRGLLTESMQEQLEGTTS